MATVSENVKDLFEKVNKLEVGLASQETRAEGCMQIQNDRYQTMGREIASLKKVLYATLITVIATLGTIVGALVKQAVG